MAYEAEIEKLQRRYDEKPEQWFAALADAYRKAGDVQLAEDVVRQGIERRPNYVSGHIVLGRCLVDQEMDEQATEVFEQVLGLDAENIIALKSLAEIAQRAGDYGQATDWMNRLLEVDPGNEEAVALLEQLQSGPPPAVDEGIAEPEEVPATSVVGAPAAEVPPAPIEPVDEIGPPPEPDVAPPSPEVEQDAAAGAGDDGSPGSPIDTHAATMLVSAAPEDAFAPPPDWQPASATAAEAEAGTGGGTGDEQDEPAESVGDIFGEVDAGEGVPAGDAGAGVPDTEKPTAEMMADPRPEPFAGQEDVGFAAADTEIGDVVQEEDPMRIAGERPSSVDMVIGVELSREEGGAESLTVREDSTDDLLPGDTSPQVGDAESDYEVSSPSPHFAWADEVQPPAGTGLEEDKEGELPAVVEDAAEVAGGPPPGEVVTETMAEVYAQQGLFAQARSVYEQLLEHQPDSADLRQRLQDLLQREQVAETGAPSGRARILSASATGGTSVRELFQGLLEARPGAIAVVTSAPQAPPEPAPDERDEPRPLEQAFEGDDVGRGAPTRPAGDEPSLSSVFGTSEAPTRESIPTPVPPDAAAPSSGKEGMSFDAFYGQQPPPVESEADSEEGDDEEDFKDWLTSLKS